MELRYGKPEEAGMSAERVQNVVNLAKSWVSQGITPSLVILAARRGIIVAHEAFGSLTPEPDSPPLELNTIFPMASITKPITATLAMILVEDGLLGLNRPVQWYIPEFVGEGKDKVMVHHLMTHTSGLRDEDMEAHAEKKKGTVEIPPPDETQHPGMHERLFLMYDAPLLEPPGTEMSYCNNGVDLLGEIVRRISGQNIDDFARKRLFEPLGMKDTFYIVPDSVEHRTVKRPEDAPGHLYDSLYYQKEPSGCGGVHSTAMDMAIFEQMFLNSGVYGNARILSPASVDAMTRNQIPGISARWESEDEFFPEASWGFCWNIQGNKKRRGSLQSPKTLNKGGTGGVFLWIDPVYEIVGAYFSVMLIDNCGDLFMNAVTAAIVD